MANGGEPCSRRYAHSEGLTHIVFDSSSQLVTCGCDSDVRIFDGDDSTEFSVSSEKLTAIACYQGPSGVDLVAVGMDDHSVQSFQLDGTSEGLLMRFTAPVTSLAVSADGSLLAAGSGDFSIRVIQTANSAEGFNLVGHEAAVLCVNFDPKGDYLASSSCDGSVKIWSLKNKECVQSLPVLSKSSDVSTAKSLGLLAWKPSDGKILAVPVGSEVRLYDRSSWKLMFTLSDDHHKEAVNGVCWSPCGCYLASGGSDGALCVWDLSSRLAYCRLSNEEKAGVTSLVWDSRGQSSQEGNKVMTGDVEGCVAVFEGVYPDKTSAITDDTLVDDSLLMEGIPPDDIFSDFTEDPPPTSEDHVMDDQDSVVQARKRRRLLSEEAADSVEVDSVQSVVKELGDPLAPSLPASRKGAEFSDKLVQVTHPPVQPSSTPDHLQHRFMVYNLVGVVRCHSDESSSMVEVDFHNTSTHHSFSLANYSGYNMAALTERALILASERDQDQPSQLMCMNFSSWDSNKEWSLSLPSKESIVSLALGDGWIAVATNKHFIRLYTVGGMQRELLSCPGSLVSVVGWGSRLGIVYQTGLGTANVFGLTVWVLDVHRRKEVHPQHTLPLSRHSTLEWIGFSEEGVLVSYDSRGMVRTLSSCYGRCSWSPVLDTNKQLGNKTDHYFLVGMTHNPTELRAILCKGLDYPPVHPKPVMSTLSLKLPLCENDSEKTQLESEYIQMTMIQSATPDSGNTELIQQLMKLFALACKSDRDYRAYEIAEMLPDQYSMNLALTYASRTNHLRLSRRINELIQQKLASNGYSDNDDLDSLEHEETHNVDLQYATDRKELLAQRTGAPSKHTLQLINKRRGKDQMSRKGPESSDESGDDEEMNVTEELFSDNESEKEPTPEDFGDNETNFSSSAPKRHNPFKLATPVAKSLNLDRQSSFLDKVVSSDHERKKKSVRNAKPPAKIVKDKKKKSKASTKTSAIRHQSLKGRFFQSSKASPAQETDKSECSVGQAEDTLNNVSNKEVNGGSEANQIP